MSEQIINVVKAYSVGKPPDSIVVVIPKEAADKHNFRPGDKFCVKIDADGRLIYQKIKEVSAE